MTESFKLNPTLLTINPKEFIRVVVQTGKIKPIKRDEITGMFGGAHFPGVSACIPFVLWSIQAEYALAIHTAFGSNNPRQIAEAIARHQSQYGAELNWSIHAAEVISAEYPEISVIPNRLANHRYISSLTRITQIPIDGSTANLSFHPAHGYRIVE